MRLIIKLDFGDGITLPIQYNHIVQAAILKWIGDENYSSFIHDSGYEYNNRKYKMYSFSRLEGKFTMDKIEKKITYVGDGYMTICSADEKFLTYLLSNIITVNEKIELLNQKIGVSEVKASNRKLGSEELVFTKSPIVIYSTFEHEGRRKTYYYNPMEEEFEILLRRNLIYKFNAIYGRDPKNSKFAIEPQDSSKLKERIVIYKGIVIKGWDGYFIIKGSPELLNIAYDTGLGSKNSQGFGCIEVRDKRPPSI